MAKKKSPQPRLSREERQTVREVVTSLRHDAGSPQMRLISDEIACEVLADEHGISVSLAKVRKIA